MSPKKMPDKMKKMPDEVKRTLHTNPVIKAAFDDGAEWGKRDAKHEILTYLETLVMDKGIDRGSDEYSAILKIVRKVAKKFNDK